MNSWNMNQDGRHYAKSNKPITEGSLLHGSTYIKISKIVKLIEPKKRMVVALDWEDRVIAN